MMKLIKAVVVLAVLGVGIGLVVHYAGGSKAKSSATADQKAKTVQTEQKPKEGMQPQEKYGFAPVGDGG
jgi:hypothetical protein